MRAPCTLSMSVQTPLSLPVAALPELAWRLRLLAGIHVEFEGCLQDSRMATV